MAQTADPRKDGDTDDRFTGVADASAFAAAVEELAALSRRPGWVTEEPELHLVPHLRSANVEGLRLVECQTREDGGPGRCSGPLPSPRPACVSTVTAMPSYSRLSPASLTALAICQPWSLAPAHPPASGDVTLLCGHIPHAA